MIDIHKALRKFGLTSNEAKAYLTLITHGPLDAKKIALAANIPYSKIYIVLNNLVKKGWVYKSSDRSPTVFKPRSPKEAIMRAKNTVISQLDSYEKTLIRSLQPLFEARLTAEKPDIWLIYGESNIREKLIDMIRYTKEELSIALHIALKEVFPFLHALNKRGIKVRLLVTKVLVPSTKYLGSEIRFRDHMFGGGAISDMREAMIIIGDREELIGIWSNHAGLVNIAKHYFESLWATSAPSTEAR